MSVGALVNTSLKSWNSDKPTNSITANSIGDVEEFEVFQRDWKTVPKTNVNTASISRGVKTDQRIPKVDPR